MTAPHPRMFFCGSPLDTDVLGLVIERVVTLARLRPVHIADRERVRLLHDSYPMLVPAPGQRAEGAVLDRLDEREFQRVSFSEADEYRFERCEVRLADGSLAQAQFCAEAAMPGGALGEWRLQTWRRRHKPR